MSTDATSETASAGVRVSTGRPPTGQSEIPPLENGDRLSRDEFERRYAAMPQLKKAELIDGVVYVMSLPVSGSFHGGPHADAVYWLRHYALMTNGIEVLDNSTVRLDWDNEPQPDISMRVLPAHGGQSTDDGRYVGGAPELCFEVAASSASYDLHQKKEAFRRNGVQEYLVWRTKDNSLDWFVLRGGVYEQLELSEEGILRSAVFPGLWLAPAALLDRDLKSVLSVLNEGLASETHKNFCQKLAAAGPEPA